MNNQQNNGGETDPHRDGRGIGPRANRRIAKLLIVAIVAGSALWFGGRYIYTSYMDYRVLTTNVDRIPQDAGLMRYAETRAKPVFMQNCASCHGADLKGNHTRGVPNMTDHDWLYGTGDPSSIEVTITYGVRSGNPRSRNLAIMPSFTHPNDPLEKINPLTPPEIRAIVNFLLALESRHPPDPSLVDKGKTLFEGTAYCYDCHTQDAKGDHDIGAPDLADDIWLYGHGSYKDIYRSIEFGHQGVCPAWIHRLSPAKIRELALYVYSKSQRTPNSTVTSRGRKASAS